MTYTAKIGSIELQNAELYDNKTVDPKGTETFNVVCPNDQALQIMGYGGAIQKTSNGQARILTSQSSWGIIPLDMSVTLQNNEDITNRGVYAINTVTPSLDMGPDNVTLAVEAEYITDFDDYLYMRYWADQLDHGYTDTSPVSLLNEAWTSFNSSIWQNASITRMSGASATVSSNQLALTGAMTSAPGRIYVASQAKYATPFTLTVPFTLPAAPSSSSGWESWMYLSNSASDESTGATVFRVGFTGNKSTIKFYVQQDIAKKGWTTLYSTTVTTTSPSIQIQYNSDLSAQVWLNTGSGLVSKWVGKTQSQNSSVYLAFELNNWSSTSYTAKFGNLVVSGIANAKQPVAVGLPVNATLDTSPSFYRVGDSMSIPMYDMTSAPADLFYKTTIDNFFKGTVQAFSTNYSDGNPRQVMGFKQVLDPTKFYVTNGLIKLVTTSNSVQFQYFDGSSWQTLNTFGMGTINVIEPVFVSPFKFVLKINKTYWTVEHGKRYVRVNHPYTNLSYTLKGNYDYVNSSGSISTVTNPASGTNISMQYIFYSNIYNTGDTWKLQLLRQYQQDIKSDSIPAAELTGIGVFDSGITNTSPDGYLYNAREFWQQIEQAIGVKQP